MVASRSVDDPDAPPEVLTRAERAERARLATERAKAELGGYRGGSNSPKVHADATAPCPDPFSPDSVRELWAVAYRRMWNLLHAPLTDQDTLGAFGAVRLAAGIGKREEATSTAPIPFVAIMGGGKAGATGAKADRGAMSGGEGQEGV